MDRRAESLALAATVVLLLCAPAGGGALQAQQPDSATARRPPPQAEQVPDSAAAADTLPLATFPVFPEVAARGPGAVESWTHSDLLAGGALTPADLLEFSPHTDALRAGFLEGPQAALFAGAGPTSLRYELDGYVMAPLLGGPLDLHLPSLVELQGLCLVREPGGYRLTGEPYRNDRRDPYSRIEAGTGDYDVNVLRGLLVSRVRRARVGFGYDRIDTDGARLESAQRDAVWASITHELPLALWGQLEYRSLNSERRSFSSPKRRDWILRLRREFPGGWAGDFIAGRASQEESTPLSEGGTSLEEVSVGQFALRAAHTADDWRAQLTLRKWTGDTAPDYESEGAVQWRKGRVAVYFNAQRVKWDEFIADAFYSAFEFRLPFGLRAILEAEDGERGLFGADPIRRLFFTRVSAGGEASWLGWRLGARSGRWRVNPSPGVGAPVDSATSLRGGTANVFEAWATGPLFRLFGGQIAVGGRYTAHDSGPFLYWPETSWRIDGRYYIVAVGDQLEIWLEGMGGIRGAMRVPDPSGASLLTTELNWFRGEIVVRVKDVHIYWNYEFFNAATEAPADVPGLAFPPARTHFGVKWEFWN